MVLGSTAAEVVDHAPCPVLVARSDHARQRSPSPTTAPRSARTAEAMFTSWPLFADREISVVTVAEVAVPVAAGFTPGLYDQVLESYTKSADEAREEVRGATTAAHRLADAGSARALTCSRGIRPRRSSASPRNGTPARS